MSQTEAFLLLLLGFSVAALLALFFGRFAWGLATRRRNRQMQRQLPATVAQLQAERDKLRAEYAMISQKLGARLDEVKSRMVEQSAEVTRNRNRLQTLETELEEKTAALAARDQEAEELRKQLAAVKDEAALAQATIENLSAEVARRSAEVDELRQDLAGRGPMPPTVLRQRKKLLPVESEPQDAVPAKLRRRIEKVTAPPPPPQGDLSGIVPAEERALDPALADSLKDTEELQKELARLDEVWSSKLDELEMIEADPNSTADKPKLVANVIDLANRIRTLQKDLTKP